MPPLTHPIVAVLLALALTWSAPRGVARAEANALLLVDPDPAFRRAAEVALAPWGLRVRAQSQTAPGATLPGSVERARALSSDHDAVAIAWLSETAEGHALWVYEQRSDRVVAQPVSQGPPYDAAQAAALALTLKALLRHSLAAPEQERFGAQEAAPRHGMVLGIAGGVRAFELSDGSAEARLWLSSAYLWPALGGAIGPLLEANLGFGGVEADTSEARTTLRAHALAFGALGRWPLGKRFDVGASTAVTVRLTRLSGELSSPAGSVSVRRANPTLAARLSGGVYAGRVRLSLRAGLDAPLRKQRYLVDGQQVLSLGAVAFEAGLGAEIFLQ